MKLIRLSTDSEFAEFNNTINSDDLYINPNSQIALKSLTLEQLDASIVIDGQNNEFTYQLINNNPQTITLNDGFYGAQNYNVLFNELNNKLNLNAIYDRTVVNSNRTIGLDWLITDDDNKTNIGFKCATVQDHKNLWLETASIQATKPGSTTEYRVGSTVKSLDYNNCITIPFNIPKGNGYLRARIGEMNYDPALGANQGVLIGFTKTLFEDPSLVTEADITYGCSVVVSSGGTNAIISAVLDGNDIIFEFGGDVSALYEVGDITTVSGITNCDVFGTKGQPNGMGRVLEVAVGGDNTKIKVAGLGVGVDLTNADYSLAISEMKSIGTMYYMNEGIAPTATAHNIHYINDYNVNNGFIEIRVNGNQYEAVLYGPGLPIIVKAWTRTVVETLFPYIGFKGDFDHISITNIRPQISPWEKIPMISTIEQQEEKGTLGTPPPTNLRRPQDLFIQFQSPEVASFFGFLNVRVPQTLYIKSFEYTFISDKQLAIRTVVDSMIIEMLSLNLKTYDGLANQVKSILAYLPINNYNTNMVVYEPYNLLFIDINNKYKEILRNIRCRLTDSDFTPIKLTGRATLVLLIKDKDE